MVMKTWIGKILLLAVCWQVLIVPVAWGQEELIMGPKPVMENVFFNVVWGSVFGILLGAASSVIEAEKKTAPEEIRLRVYQGATWGGLIGLGLGIWLATTGITFDKNTSLLFTEATPLSKKPTFAARPLPFYLETSTQGGFRISGFKATVFHMKF